MLTTERAILIGALLIAAAIFFRPHEQSPRYQVANFNQAAVARLDTETGAIDLCGVMQAFRDLIRQPYLPTAEQFLDGSPEELKKIEQLQEQVYWLAVQSRCMALNNGRQDLR